MILKPGPYTGDVVLPVENTNRSTILPGSILADPNLGQWTQSISSPNTLRICFEDRCAQVDIKKLFEFLEKNDLLVKE
jgi:hypothetical protein